MAAADPQDNPYGGGTRLLRPPPAEIPSGVMSEQDKARILTLRLANCLIKEHRSSVLNAIQVEPWQSNARKMLVTVVDDRCLAQGELAMPPSLLRGAFYKVFYSQRFAAGPPTLPATPLNFASGTSADAGDEGKTGIALRQFGDCVARRDLNDAHALVMSAPGSAAETAAISALMPHFSACLIQGSKWTLNRSSVSAVLSEVLYREGVAGHSTEGSN